MATTGPAPRLPHTGGAGRSLCGKRGAHGVGTWLTIWCGTIWQGEMLWGRAMAPYLAGVAMGKVMVHYVAGKCYGSRQELPIWQGSLWENQWLLIWQGVPMGKPMNPYLAGNPYGKTNGPLFGRETLMG